MFDNIQLLRGCDWPGGALSADLDGDCDVDIDDLQIFVADWLLRAEVHTFPTITAPHNPPVLWYKFNDSGSNSVIDYGKTGSYTGTVVNPSPLNWDTTGGRSGGPCLNIPPVGPFPATNQSYVECASRCAEFYR